MGGNQARRRRSSRLPGFDYAAAGAYFITIVTQNRLCLFGEIIDYEMHLNDAGHAITRWWFELERKFTTIETDAFIVMPNHCHGIVIINDPAVGADLRVGPFGCARLSRANRQARTGRQRQVRPKSGCIRDFWP